MNVRSHMVRFAAACLLLALGACGGGGDGGAGTPPVGTPPVGTQPAVSAVIGAAGGTLSGPNGATVVIPPGALTTDTTITIEQTSAGSPPLPGGFSAFGLMFAFTPHGTTFAVPVTVTVPFDPASVPAGVTPTLYKTNAAMSGFDPVPGATVGAGIVTAEVTSFSLLNVGSEPLEQLFEPVRTWSFLTFPGDDGAATLLPEPDGNGTVPAGEFLEKVVPFGPTNFDATFNRSNVTVVPADQVANGLVFATADGKTYAVFAEAPSGILGTPEAVGSQTRYTQLQSFRKKKGALNASLTFTLTSVLIDVRDFSIGRLQTGLRLQGEVEMSVKAYKTTSSDPFYHAAGRASVSKVDGGFLPNAPDMGRNHLWSLEEDFDFRGADITIGPGTCFGRQFTLKPKPEVFPRTYSVDLSSVLDEEEFTVEAIAVATTENLQGPQAITDCLASYVGAFLRDPQEIGGTTLTFTGLEPTNRPLPPPPDQRLVPPASCVPGPGPNPASGVLQFDAASYAIHEFARAVPTVTVTRSGGSSGAVTATFTTSDGTAIAGMDYTPVNATVFFADGDTGQRVVEVPILPDLIDEGDKTVNLTLSQPGGCAALGAQTTAVLTILDDDAPPGGFTGLDASFGIEGKATSTAFGGDRSSMALQADGKIVMVGGTFTDFILARFNADGSLDTGFGVGGGKVITDMGSGNRAEEATAVAIQPDGKIVVVGYAAIDAAPPAPRLPPTFAIARYNTDGSLDTSFGTGGRVSGGVNGQANAVAIQPDGKIVLAGEFSFDSTSGSDFSDFTVARFNANGSLDASFGVGGSGQVATDIGTHTNLARNIVLQPNGAIVVSGGVAKVISSAPTPEAHTDLVRYNANGGLDASFGVDGKLTLAGKSVGEGLALQRDGKFVLAGSIDASVAPSLPGTVTEFALMRLNADGSPDTTFGNAGAASTAIGVGQRDSAQAVALQGDGRIVVAGSSNNVNPNFALARFNTDGTLDTSFGSLGKLTVDFFGFTDIAESVAVQPDGKIVLGGVARNNVDGYGVARVVP